MRLLLTHGWVLPWQEDDVERAEDEVLLLSQKREQAPLQELSQS